jgi:hypothetical protein
MKYIKETICKNQIHKLYVFSMKKRKNEGGGFADQK